MKRTSMFVLLILAAALVGGCSSAEAQCVGGRCASVGVWSPWGGVWYYQSPCQGGKCAVKKATEPEEPKVDEPEDAGATAAGKPPRAVSGGCSLATAPATATAKPGADNCPRGSRPGAENSLPDSGFKPFCQRVAELINAQRAALGLPALELDESLCDGCDRHSAYMQRNGFAHAYYGGRECIAQGVRSPEAVVNLWLNSSGHRAIILGSGRIIGVGCSGSFWTLRVR